MKYRVLTLDELKELDEELKQFLIVNGIDGDTWVEMNEKDKEKAKKMIELFSDTVLQKVYEKIKFLEHRNKKSCLLFNVQDDKIKLISLSTENPEIDLSSPESIHQALKEHASEIQFFKTEKPLSKEREVEIHELIQSGAYPSVKEFWDAMEKATEN